MSTVIHGSSTSTFGGDYIREWNHPTETKPTQEELNNV